MNKLLLQSVSAVADYTRVYAATKCPYVSPSDTRGRLNIKAEMLSAEDVADEYKIYEILERTCMSVLSAGHGSAWTLTCENVVLVSTEGKLAAGGRVGAQAHFAAKLHFSSVGLVIGHFWPNEVEFLRSGDRLHPPPYQFFSVRYYQGARDDGFVEDLPEQLDSLRTWHRRCLSGSSPIPEPSKLSRSDFQNIAGGV